MKKLGKLSINLNKVMKNEELVNLRGGYGYGYLIDQLACRDWYGILLGPIINDSGCNGNADNDLGICKKTYSGITHTATCIQY